MKQVTPQPKNEATAAAPATTSLAELVADRRTSLGLSYRQLAARAQLSTATIHKIAAGGLTRVPTQETLIKLADALRLPVPTLRDAVAADLGIRDFAMIEGKRQAIWHATAGANDETLDLILSVIHGLTH